MIVKPDERIYIEKGWGGEDWIVNNELYCGKLLNFEKDKKMSLHYHRIKDETFYCIGTVRLITYTDPSFDELIKSWEDLYQMVGKSGIFVFYLETGDSFHIPVQMRHIITAMENSTIVEFSTTHRDEDSVRILKGD